jgi:dienelactone hydrolase
MVLWSVVTVAFVVGPAIAATNTPHAKLGTNPQRVGLDYEKVTLHTSDGVSLAAWYVPSANGAAVVLLHGAGSTRSNVLEEAAVLADSGFGVLMVDARGHGDSEGQAMDFGWHGDADIGAATAWLAARPDVHPARIGAVGMSMGGEEAIGATGTNDVLRAVVAEGATARTAGDDAWLSDRFGVRGLLTEQLEKAQDRITDLLTSASTPSSMRAAASASDACYLLITGGAVPTERHAADHIASGAPERVQVWTVPGAGHTGGLETARQEWTNRVVEFLESALRAGSPKAFLRAPVD